MKRTQQVQQNKTDEHTETYTWPQILRYFSGLIPKSGAMESTFWGHVS